MITIWKEYSMKNEDVFASMESKAHPQSYQKEIFNFYSEELE
jgi:hypothetical protein